MAKMIVCNSCGAEFGSEEPKCPYCKTMNYKGAEKEYFAKLEEVRADMEELSAVPKEEAKKELKKQGSFMKKILLVVLVLAALLFAVHYFVEKSYERDNKADFIWQETNFPIMDELYEAGKYEELVEFYTQAEEEGKPAYAWEHTAFVRVYVSVQDYYHDLTYMEEHEEIEEWMYGLFLWNQWDIYRYLFSGELTEEELAYFADDFAAVEQSLKNDWDFDEETYQKFYTAITEPYGGVSFEDCDAYIAEWIKKKEGK